LRKLDIDIGEVKKLVDLVDSHGLEELTVEEDDLAITVTAHAPPGKPEAVPHAPEHLGAEHQPPDEGHRDASETSFEQEDLDKDIVDIVAPLVGIFYRALSADAPPFIEMGDRIEVGTEVGLIEAMKVFSPIPSEVAGEVVDIPAENGKLVSQGDVLVRVRVGEEQEYS
jgi:acetyl-CoA carboxylase biotin carboxyl carrier protein